MEYATLVVPDNKKHRKSNNTGYDNTYYKNYEAPEKLIKYLFKDKKNRLVRLYGGVGVDVSFTDNAVKSMKKIKRFFEKTDGRMMAHYILSIPYNICDNPFTVYQIAWEVICNHFFGYQVVFAVHENSGPAETRKNIHVHFAINSVSAIDGKKWDLRRGQFKKFKFEIEKLANSYILDKDLFNQMYSLPVLLDDISDLLP